VAFVDNLLLLNTDRNSSRILDSGFTTQKIWSKIFYSFTADTQVTSAYTVCTPTYRTSSL